MQQIQLSHLLLVVRHAAHALLRALTPWLPFYPGHVLMLSRLLKFELYVQHALLVQGCTTKLWLLWAQ